MIHYKVKEPSIQKLDDLAMITINYRRYEKVWQLNGGYDTRKNMNYWKDKLDKWHEENLEKINE